MRTLDVDLIGQFLLGRSESLAPQGWAMRRSAGWCLASHPSLPVIEIRSREGVLLGWLLGYPITADGTLLSSGAALPFTLSLQDGAAAFERGLYSLGGRFAAICGLPGTPRVYLDPCGSLAVVFCPEESLVASNPMLVPYSEKTKDNQGAIDPATGEMRWYFGLTPRRGIERLLPNHVLDLSTWQVSRHWPSAEDLAVTKDTASAVAELAALLERHITAALRARPIYMALTAGRHTRMLLACARHHVPQLTFFTTQIHDAHGRFDLKIAEQIARRFALAHLSLQWQAPTQRDLDEWVYRTGGCVMGRPAQAIPTLRQLDPARGILTGMAGSVGEAELWRKTDLKNPTASWRAELLDRHGFAPEPAMVERAERWFHGLPTRNVLEVQGLRGLEQYMASCVAPQEYGFPRDAFVLSPYCHRRIVQLKLTLPPRYRWRDRLPDDLLRQRWPELLEIPFDKAFGLRGAAPFHTRALRGVLQYIVPSSARR